MSFYRKAPDTAKRKKKLMRLSGLTEGLIAPALVKKSAYLGQLIANWPQIAGPFAAWAKPADIHPASGAEDDGTLTLSIHSGRGPEAMALQAEILERVNAFAGFRLVAKLKVKQDLPLDMAKDASAESASQSAPQSAPQSALEQPKAASLQEALARLGATLDAKSKE